MVSLGGRGLHNARVTRSSLHTLLQRHLLLSHPNIHHQQHRNILNTIKNTLNTIMADILDFPTQDQLVRPPYRWWDSHPPYVSSSGAPALTASAPSIPSSPTIDFLHPSYDYPANILFSLPAVDILRGPSSRPGVHHGTALSACIIVAANRCGRLTTSAAPPTPAELASPVAAWDAVLTEPRYYFHPSGATDPSAPPYPVVPDFRSWRFPHGQLEPGWVDTEVRTIAAPL